MVAQKLKKSLEDIPLTKSIKDLANGKSTIQNEILGDLQKEFGNILPEKGEDEPIKDLAASISAQFSGTLGKATSSLISSLVGSKMPSGFNLGKVRGYLCDKFLFGPHRCDGVMLHALVNEPTQRLSSESDAKGWLDSIVVSYCSKVGITLSSASNSNTVSQTSVVSSEELLKFQASHDLLIQEQLELYARYLHSDLREGHKLADIEKELVKQLSKKLDLWTIEHGDVYFDGIKPLFDPLKVRRFDSYWNWARQDGIQLYYDIIFGRLKIINRDVHTKSIHVMNRAENDDSLLPSVEYYVKNCDPTKGESYDRLKDLGTILINGIKEMVEKDPIFVDGILFILITSYPSKRATYKDPRKW